MRIYINPIDMIKEVERDLFEMGIRYSTETVQDKNVKNDPDYETIELMGYAYTLKNTEVEDAMKLLEYMDLNKNWAVGETEERLYRQHYHLNPGRNWKNNRKVWEPFLRDGVFSYSYAERWQHQIPYVVNELTRHKNSRQAMITMYDTCRDLMNWGGRDRVPCSVSYQFIIREEKLHVIYNQRSCDFISFFAYDVYLTIMLLRKIANEIDIEPGTFIHFIGSLHAFAKDLKHRGIF